MLDGNQKLVNFPEKFLDSEMNHMIRRFLKLSN